MKARVQIVANPGGDELVVLPRSDYEALVGALSAKIQKAHDVAAYDHHKVETEEDRGCPLSSEATTPNEDEGLLELAVLANAAVRVEAEGLIAAYVAPAADRSVIIKKLISLFDGPPQREAEKLTALALGKAWQQRTSRAHKGGS